MGQDDSKPAISTTEYSDGEVDSKPAKVTTGSGRGRSSCETGREMIEAAMDQGLSATRIYQDLVGDHAYAG